MPLELLAVLAVLAALVLQPARAGGHAEKKASAGIPGHEPVLAQLEVSGTQGGASGAY